MEKFNNGIPKLLLWKCLHTVMFITTGEAEKTLDNECHDKTTGYCLTLPGKTLYLTPLLSQKKFRSYGHKDGAVKAFYKLQQEGLGKTHLVGSSRANPVSISIAPQLYSHSVISVMQQYEFTKEPIPEEKEKRMELIRKLSKYNVSLTQYDSAMHLPEIKP